MQRTVYRFVPKNRIEVKTPKGKLYLFSTERGGGRPSLGSQEHELANLFNGRRSEEEIRDLFLKTQGLQLSAEDLRSFIDKLVDVGLLEPAEPPERARPIGVARIGRAEQADGGANAGAAPFVKQPPTRNDETPERPIPVDAAPFSSRHHRSAPHAPFGPRGAHARHSAGVAPEEEALELDAEDIAFDETKFDRQSDDSGATAWSDAGGGFAAPPGNPPGGGYAGHPVAGGRFDGSERRTREARWLVQFPIGWLLPLATPLAWAAWSRYLTLLLGLAMLGTGMGLWFARVELARDLVQWFRPLTIFHALVLSVLTINLASQLARAAEFRRRIGHVPPFGIYLASYVLPVFAANVSGLTSAKNPQASLAVTGASVSATATFCLLAYFGWFLTKNNGTTLPLLCLGLAFMASIRLVFSLNPLGNTDGYNLIALWTGVPDLRQRAFVTLIAGLTGKSLPPGWNKSIPYWVLWTYALATLGYLVAVMVLLTIFGGGWLERHWGGFGVVVFLTLATLVFWDPVRDARARLNARQARRPRQERTTSQRILSMTKLAAVLSVLVVLGLIPYRYEPGGDFVLKPLQTSRTDVRSLISGRVDDLPVKEGDAVRTGQILARISGDEERKNVGTTEATIRELQAQLAKALAGSTQEQLAVARQKVAAAKTRYEFSKSKEQRYSQLKNSGFSSPQEYENILGQAETDREALAQAEKELELLLVGTRQEEVDALRAAIDQQKANLIYHRQQLEYTEIRAPIPGHIVSGSLLTAAGNYLKSGDLFATIEDTSKLLAEIRIPQSDIGFVRLAAPIRLKAWTQPDLEIKGMVQIVAPNAEETPSGKMVRVTSELDNKSGALKSGLTGYAKIEGEEMPAALAFTRVVVRFFQVEFWSWLP